MDKLQDFKRTLILKSFWTVQVIRLGSWSHQTCTRINSCLVVIDIADVHEQDCPSLSHSMPSSRAQMVLNAKPAKFKESESDLSGGALTGISPAIDDQLLNRNGAFRVTFDEDSQSFVWNAHGTCANMSWSAWIISPCQFHVIVMQSETARGGLCHNNRTKISIQGLQVIPLGKTKFFFISLDKWCTETPSQEATRWNEPL